MQITALTVRNFRGLKFAELKNLGSTVIVAGPNGCGKSCLFDAIRLLKSMFGEYQPSEIDRWFGEFQIPRDEFGNINPLVLFNDRSKAMEISCTIRLHPEERRYLNDHGEAELLKAAGGNIPPLQMMRLGPQQIQAHREAVMEFVSTNLPLLHADLQKEDHELWLSISPTGEIRTSDNFAVPLVFGRYMPGRLGLIDYHGPQRHFQREIFQSLNVNLDAHRQQQQHSALYDYINKYNNVKSELATGYVQEALAQKAGVSLAHQSGLTDTLRELFATFFPDKKFNGPVPTDQGSLEFPVIGKDGARHDLNELSSGEKEILYGYLRIRNSAPRFSIVMLDEPELHLNPGLIRKLPKFYAEHLGRALDNQIWLITHSDALIRETIGREEFSLYHMSSAFDVDESENQTQRLEAAEDAEQLVIDLVGDLAAFRPGGKLVIFEGGGESEYDTTLVKKLFPEISDKVNIIPGGGKNRVRSLHEVLDKASSSGKIPFEVRSVTDWDGDAEDNILPGRFRWDVYHIENYLIDPNFIYAVLRSLDITSFASPAAVWGGLRVCAKATIPTLVQHELTKSVGSEINKLAQFKLGKPDDLAMNLHRAVTRTQQRLAELAELGLSESALRLREAEYTAKFESQLSSDEWVRTFRGRDILTEFAHRYGEGLGYQRMRTLIANRMAEYSYQPIGMGATLSRVLSDSTS